VTRRANQRLSGRLTPSRGVNTVSRSGRLVRALNSMKDFGSSNFRAADGSLRVNSNR